MWFIIMIKIFKQKFKIQWFLNSVKEKTIKKLLIHFVGTSG